MQNIRIFKTGYREVEYKSIFFPGGEPHVAIDSPGELDGEDILLDARVENMDTFGMLLTVTDAVKRCGPSTLELFLPYFPGARQDREESGYALTAKVYADILNLQGYDSVYILDPHSPVAPALVDNCYTLSAVPLVKQFLKDLPSISGIICPDAGAERRSLELAKELDCPAVVFARKKRDPRTGQLSGFSMDALPKSGNYLLADDICDGGGTFLGLADEYRKDNYGDGDLFLWVTHGIFSKGLHSLCEQFSKIGCSDSFSRGLVRHPKLQIIEVLENFKIRGGDHCAAV